MKLIGIELRVGAGIMQQKLEALVVPVSIAFARAKDDPYGNNVRPQAEVTFHTTDGDVTVTANLPFNMQDSVMLDTANDCYTFLRKQVEK